ncbi:MAG: LysR substrate-binding domain-containing protein [Fluviicoccus sp.]|uniref:LysR substrate-binding domain-containing protein n=1 Tax=Fluviicoccus sp. TaxID=2003552 RepID=UPI0027278644|nr:LysR substrate-binding domain-containing protein [Fluviicoccus sp.]MDO8329053.1 LysR substrate-binding domain-containing protein [Fluviicoccus sp.]
MDRPSPLRATPQQLRAFEAAARLLSMTRAAEELHLSQPTVSIQLRELAEQVGLPLFEQHGKRIQLTAAGLELQDTVSEVFGLWARFESRMAELQGVRRGTLRLAAVTTAEYLLPQLLGPFCEVYPGIDVQLAVENRASILGRLDKGLDELTVMMKPPVDARLRTEPFRDTPLVVVAARNHRLAGKRVSLTELAGERWLMRESGSGCRLLAEEHFTEQGFKPQVAMSLGSNEAIKHAVAGGLGVTVLSRHALGDDPARDNLCILEVGGFPLKGAFSFVMRDNRKLSPVARAFLEYVRGV